MKFFKNKKGTFTPTLLPILYGLIMGVAVIFYTIFPETLPIIIAISAGMIVTTSIIYVRLLIK